MLTSRSFASWRNGTSASRKCASRFVSTTRPCRDGSVVKKPMNRPTVCGTSDSQNSDLSGSHSNTIADTSAETASAAWNIALKRP